MFFYLLISFFRVVFSSNIIYSFGNNVYNQLGRSNSDTSFPLPITYSNFSNENIIQVTGGAEFTLVLTGILFLKFGKLF